MCRILTYLLRDRMIWIIVWQCELTVRPELKGAFRHLDLSNKHDGVKSLLHRALWLYSRCRRAFKKLSWRAYCTDTWPYKSEFARR